MSNFKRVKTATTTIQKQAIQKRLEKKPSKQRKSKSDTKVSDDLRKLLREPENGLQKEVSTASTNLSVLPFIPLLCCVLEFRRFAISYKRVHGGGLAKFKNENAVLLCYLALFSGSGVGKSVRGVSVSKLCLLYYGSDSLSNIRNMNYSLCVLIDFGLVVRVSIVNGYKYQLSVHAEKIFINSVTRDDMKGLKKIVSSFIG